MRNEIIFNASTSSIRRFIGETINLERFFFCLVHVLSIGRSAFSMVNHLHHHCRQRGEGQHFVRQFLTEIRFAK